MKTYYVATTWMYEKEFSVQANSAEEAAQNIQDDHWDIESIDIVSEA